MNWLAFLMALVQLVTWLINKAEQNRWIAEGEKGALANLLREQADAIAKADAARSAARARNAAVPRTDSLPNDEFRRD